MADINITLDATDAIKDSNTLDKVLVKLESRAKTVESVFKKLRLTVSTSAAEKKIFNLEKALKSLSKRTYAVKVGLDTSQAMQQYGDLVIYIAKFSSKYPAIIFTQLRKSGLKTQYTAIKSEISVYSKLNPIVLHTRLSKKGAIGGGPRIAKSAKEWAEDLGPMPELPPEMSDEAIIKHVTGIDPKKAKKMGFLTRKAGEKYPEPIPAKKIGGFVSAGAAAREDLERKLRAEDIAEDALRRVRDKEARERFRADQFRESRAKQKESIISGLDIEKEKAEVARKAIAQVDEHDKKVQKLVNANKDLLDVQEKQKKVTDTVAKDTDAYQRNQEKYMMDRLNSEKKIADTSRKLVTTEPVPTLEKQQALRDKAAEDQAIRDKKRRMIEALQLEEAVKKTAEKGTPEQKQAKWIEELKAEQGITSEKARQAGLVKKITGEYAMANAQKKEELSVIDEIDKNLNKTEQAAKVATQNSKQKVVLSEQEKKLAEELVGVENQINKLREAGKPVTPELMGRAGEIRQEMDHLESARKIGEDYAETTEKVAKKHRGFEKAISDTREKLSKYGTTSKDVLEQMKGIEARQLKAKKDFDDSEKGITNNIKARWKLRKELRETGKEMKDLEKQMHGMKSGGGALSTTFGKIAISLTAIAATFFIMQELSQWFRGFVKIGSDYIKALTQIRAETMLTVEGTSDFVDEVKKFTKDTPAGLKDSYDAYKLLRQEGLTHADAMSKVATVTKVAMNEELKLADAVRIVAHDVHGLTAQYTRFADALADTSVEAWGRLKRDVREITGVFLAEQDTWLSRGLNDIDRLLTKYMPDILKGLNVVFALLFGVGEIFAGTLIIIGKIAEKFASIVDSMARVPDRLGGVLDKMAKIMKPGEGTMSPEGMWEPARVRLENMKLKSAHMPSLEMAKAHQTWKAPVVRPTLKQATSSQEEIYNQLRVMTDDYYNEQKLTIEQHYSDMKLVAADFYRRAEEYGNASFLVQAKALEKLAERYKDLAQFELDQKRISAAMSDQLKLFNLIGTTSKKYYDEGTKYHENQLVVLKKHTEYMQGLSKEGKKIYIEQVNFANEQKKLSKAMEDYNEIFRLTGDFAAELYNNRKEQISNEIHMMEVRGTLQDKWLVQLLKEQELKRFSQSERIASHEAFFQETGIMTRFLFQRKVEDAEEAYIKKAHQRMAYEPMYYRQMYNKVLELHKDRIKSELDLEQQKFDIFGFASENYLRKQIQMILINKEKLKATYGLSSEEADAIYNKQIQDLITKIKEPYVQIYQTMYDELWTMTDSFYQQKLIAAKLDYDHMIRIANITKDKELMILADRLYERRKSMAAIQKLETGKTAGEGITAGMERLMQDSEPLAKRVSDAWVQGASSVEQAWKAQFFDVMEMNFNNLQDAALNFLKSIQKMLIDVLYQQVMYGDNGIITKVKGYASDIIGKAPDVSAGIEASKENETTARMLNLKAIEAEKIATVDLIAISKAEALANRELINSLNELAQARSAAAMSQFANWQNIGGASQNYSAVSSSNWSKVVPLMGPMMSHASGGWINEPIVGYGTRSGRGYSIGENGPELVLPPDKIPRAQGGTPNVKVEVKNQTGVDADAKQGEVRWDGDQWVVGVIMDAYDRDRYGMRSMMRSRR